MIRNCTDLNDRYYNIITSCYRCINRKHIVYKYCKYRVDIIILTYILLSRFIWMTTWCTSAYTRKSPSTFAIIVLLFHTANTIMIILLNIHRLANSIAYCYFYDTRILLQGIDAFFKTSLRTRSCHHRSYRITFLYQ